MADKVPIITTEEMAKLPRWAQVAFAIRCARRVQPVFKAMWPDAPDEHVAAIEHVIQRAERLLVGNEGTLAANAADIAARVACRAANKAADAARWAAAPPDKAAVADAAAYAAGLATAIDSSVCGWAHRAAYTPADAASPSRTARAASHAAEAADLYDDARAPIQRDFETLMVLGQREHWNDQTRPSLESLPPLWPEGEEPNWKKLPGGQDNQRTNKNPGVISWWTPIWGQRRCRLSDSGPDEHGQAPDQTDRRFPN